MMTTDIEKQFFDTFGIELKEIINLTFNGAKFKTETIKEYPQISDTHYLQLLCLLAKGLNSVSFFKDQDINDIKNTILNGFILGQEFFTKQQVQAIFKEG